MENYLGENIKYLLKKYRMSGTELSKRLNVSQQLVSKWQTSNGPTPSIEKLVDLGKVFDYTVDVLINIDLKTEDPYFDTDDPLNPSYKQLPNHPIDIDLFIEAFQKLVDNLKSIKSQ